jgi:hypothetical protein
MDSIKIRSEERAQTSRFRLFLPLFEIARVLVRLDHVAAES